SQINMALQPVDDIAISFMLTLRLYIDFGSIEPLRLQIEMNYNDKTMALITYQGGYAEDENGIYENSTVYVDLSGLGFPSVKLEGIQLGAVLRNMIGGLGAPSEDGATSEDTQNNVQNAGVNAQNVASNSGTDSGTGSTIEKQGIDRVYLENYGWTERLLLLTFGADETSLAITGALAYSLLANASKNDAISSLLGGAEILVPMFRNLQVGYSEEDGVYGLCLRLTDDTPYEKAFRIGLNIGGSFDMWADSDLEQRDSSIDAREAVEGSSQDGIVYEDIGIISKVALSLELEARVRTKDSEEKPPQLIAVQNLLQSLLGLSADTINFDVQDTVLVFTVGLTVYADLADMTNTTLQLSIGLTGEELIGVYFLGKVNTAYINLSGLGFFQAALNGVDVLGIIDSFLGSFLGDEGINLNEMLAGVLTVEDKEDAAISANNALSNAGAQTEAVSLGDKAQNASIDLITATDAPLLKILMSNEEIIINPNMAIIQSLLGDSMVLPSLSDIRLSINLYQGLNNLNMRIKLDQKGNYLNLGVQEGNFAIAIGSTAQLYQLTSIGDESQYGGIEGLTLGVDSAGNIAANIDALNLAQGILDVISFSDFTIYIEKRNDYFFLRNLKYGGANGTLDTASLGTSFSTGPTYFSPIIREKADESGLTAYDHAFVSKGGAFDWSLNLPVIGEFDIGGLFKAYEPIFFDNAYRRIRLALNKTMTNKTEIPIAQLTQVANVQGSIANSSEWEPQGLTAFLKSNVLHLSLSNILVIDLSGLINTVAGWILSGIGSAINGVTAGLGKTVIDIIWGIAGPYVSTWIADMIGDATGYGSPLRVGQILDDVLGKGAGGIPLVNLYLPEFLPGLIASLKPVAEDTEFGTLYGKVETLNENTGEWEPVEGATVSLENGRYVATTDKDGYYAFINIRPGTYQVKVTKSGYNDLPRRGEPVPSATVLRSNEYPATEANFSLAKYQETIWTNVHLRVNVIEEYIKNSTATQPVKDALVQILIDGAWVNLTATGLTDASGQIQGVIP
ncbi:MAG: carboxypeptidase regulatory-like domain-containing protein, partial [Clostridia bacterium]|nr:carboxypeptidase regulatory-like domain-containing protein [Clostridia bacterium]